MLKLKKIAETILGQSNEQKLKKLMPILREVNARAEWARKLSDAELRAQTERFRERLESGETTDDILPEAFAVV
ncbi:hypothetical protein J7K76_02070, partial [Candidatus Bipolaricaulota bacterium]|nr:hypothetical protein [Candidatus Bipolaricaulota bacterium]